jgi:HK97 family phage prohead protease
MGSMMGGALNPLAAPAPDPPVRFAGYAAIFDAVDKGGDVIRRGAFADSLARRRAIPLLWQHDSASPIGTVDLLAEDKRGLRLVARIDGKGSTAARAAALVADGRLTGLSFGYRINAAQSLPDGSRELSALDLVEVSLVPFPMQPAARVLVVESGPALGQAPKITNPQRA